MQKNGQLGAAPHCLVAELRAPPQCTRDLKNGNTTRLPPKRTHPSRGVRRGRAAKARALASTKHRGQLRNGPRRDERQNHKSMSFASTTKRPTKLRKYVFLSDGLAFLVRCRSHNTRHRRDKHGDISPQMTESAPAPGAQVPKTPKVCAITFPLTVHGSYRIT